MLLNLQNAAFIKRQIKFDQNHYSRSLIFIKFGHTSISIFCTRFKLLVRVTGSTGAIFTKIVVPSSSQWPLQNKAEDNFDPSSTHCVDLASSWLIIALRRVGLTWKQKFVIPNECTRRNVNKGEGIREVYT